MAKPWLLVTLSTFLGTPGLSRPAVVHAAAVPRTTEAPPSASRNRLPPDLAAVIRRGVLRVGLPPDRSSYFVVRGRVLGLELELLEAFARDLGVRLEVVPIASVDDRYAALADRRVDAIAGRLDVDPRASKVARWSRAVATSPLVLVQPPQADLPHPWLAESAPYDGLIDDPRASHPYVERIDDARGATVGVAESAGWRGLMTDLPADLETVVVTGATTAEDLVAQVSDGEVGLAVVREDIARMEAATRPLTLGPRVGASVGSRVAFRANAVGLDRTFDEWLTGNAATVDRLTARYLEDPRAWARRVADHTAVLETGTLSPYDALLQHHGSQYGLDWRLLAALSFQESRWRRRARSGAGAVGLMQLMPATARQVGTRNRWDAAQSIRGGTRYLAWLDRTWTARVPDSTARLAIVLASYNAGLGHVADARRLASANGQDPDDWEAVAEWLLKLEQPEWSRHPLVRHGYCRGSEPVQYVRAVLDRWQHFRAMTAAAESDVAAG